MQAPLPSEQNKPIREENPEVLRVRDAYINKVVKVETNNGRTFYGRLTIVDDKCNLLLSECISECPAEVSCPVNNTLHNLLDQKIKVQNYISLAQLDQSTKTQLIDNFTNDKYYIGAAMIRGSDIVTIHVQA